MAARGVRVEGALVGVAAALAVVLAYVFGGPQLVWIVAAAEVALVMLDVARRFRVRGHEQPSAEGPEGAHCERCRRARERLDGGSVGDAVGHQ
ncbi:MULTISPECIES: hypothetical protein [unclassified Kitasatospora]|uniref:hypothetical protein n=1 Tax=unclassified Kitasatospora TaxID=2633591 RepID=UPI00070D8D40|nr:MULTISPECIES: hypothetical protein [unclassified Kitasatospora]KQV23932.1 hypothetical protein ASC99_01610 [Kitasatospora sp. Root107]KRB67356.1 hypothetical protein ASE03_03125 [Kitasatospora sp. Root187]